MDYQLADDRRRVLVRGETDFVSDDRFNRE
jgi:hypothetical protein